MTITLLLLSSLHSITFAASAWKGEETIDPMTDAKSYGTVTNSLKPVWAHKKAALGYVAVCKRKAVSLVLLHPFVLHKSVVKMRIDRQPAFYVYTEVTGDMKGLLMGDRTSKDSRPEDLVAKMANGSRMLVQYEDAAGATVFAEFSLDGFAAEKKKVDASCK